MRPYTGLPSLRIVSPHLADRDCICVRVSRRGAVMVSNPTSIHKPGEDTQRAADVISSLWCLWWRLLRSPPQQPRTILEVTCRLKHFGFARSYMK